MPYALDARGRVAAPVTAGTGEAFSCPACGERLSPVRAHERRVRQADGVKTVSVRAHFAHRVGASCRVSRETVEHLCAKYLLAQLLEDAGRDGKSVRLTAACGACGEVKDFRVPLTPGATAEVEVRWGAFRLDVAALAPGSRAVLLGVEVLASHAVPQGKGEALTVPWVEVEADVRGLLSAVHAPPGTAVTLDAVNTNLFRTAPCVCGNDTPTRQQAEELGRARQAAADAARAEDAQRRADHAARLEELRAGAAGGRYATLGDFVRAFLAEHAPDRHARLGPYRLVIAPCPGCRATMVFFDTGGMYTYPHWNAALHHRASPVHPWASRCVACGWTGPAPARGALLHEDHGRGLKAAPQRRDLDDEALRPWWQRD
ncbi:hypothetical protein [Deinococcus enclensis]|uniref:RNA-binding Zn-ribbon protein involved in translation (DUF1610 family) n=1 Tax=Deinococcus enclensis TaxID=1049582 RepID=A0ABT9MFP6_9DEIO|nr:hypothetical protein [Deinococcus enclensis]MDP9765425.1 putative RNA-binding Zn-ribbon protein involved in translation (DUF1610 family) [Deinococcus enclensis]